MTAVIDCSHYYFNTFLQEAQYVYLYFTYGKPISEVEKYLPAHINYLEEHYDTKDFICSGRKIPRTGGIILCNCNTKQDAERIIECDPFFQEKIAQYEIVEFIPSKSSESFKAIIAETR